MEITKSQIAALIVTAVLFLGVIVFFFHSPLYQAKKQEERQMAIEWLRENASYSIMAHDEYQAVIDKYQFTEKELAESPDAERNILLDKNPVVKWLLGIR